MLTWLKEQCRLQPPSLPVLSLACKDPQTVSRPAHPSPCLSQLLPKSQEQLVNFSEESQGLGSIHSSVWQSHVEGEGREGKEGRSESCLLVISWVS